MPNMKQCVNCQQWIPASVAECPHCKTQQPKKHNFIPIAVAIGAFAILGICYAVILKDEKQDTDFNNNAESSSYITTEQSHEENTITTKKTTATKIVTKVPEQLTCEITEFVTECKENSIFYSMCIHNPNKDYIVTPDYRITARDKDGNLLGTADYSIGMIFPDENKYESSYAFKVDEVPDTIDVELTSSCFYKQLSSSKYNGYTKLTIENYSVRDIESAGYKNKLVGEVKNPNKFDADCKIIIVYKDDSGKLMYSGLTTKLLSIPANSSTPFELPFTKKTDNYDFYVYMW